MTKADRIKHLLKTITGLQRRIDLLESQFTRAQLDQVNQLQAEQYGKEHTHLSLCQN